MYIAPGDFGASSGLNDQLAARALGLKSITQYKRPEYPFLVLQPDDLNSFEIINSEYMLSNKYSVKESDIRVGFREFMPISMIAVLEKSIECFQLLAGESHSEQKRCLSRLLTLRYNQVLLFYQTDKGTNEEIYRLLYRLSFLIN